MLQKWMKQKMVYWILAASDIAALVLAFFAAYYLRNFGLFRFTFEPVQPLGVYLVALPSAILLLLAIFASRGLYNPKQRLHTLGEIYLVSQSVTLWALIIMAGSYLVKYDYSRIIVLLFWLAAVIGLNIERLLIGKLQRFLAGWGIGVTNIIIIGLGKPAKSIGKQLQYYHRHGYRLVGFVGTSQGNGERVLGTLEQLFDLVTTHDVGQIYFADPSIPYDRILRIINDCPKNDVEFKITSNVFPLISELTSLNDLEQIPSLNLKKSHQTIVSMALKRAVDLVLSIVGIIVSAPLWLAIAVAIRLNSPGKILIEQQRVGRREKIFDVYKFRTMRADTPLYALAPNSEADVRITSIGRWLRKTSLDELPQLLNILRGEMSMVGPRPEMPFIVAQYQEWQKKRLTVKPGLTGLWQVLGRKDLPLHEHLEYDFYYVNNQSLLLDLVIIIRTIPQIIFGRGAY